MSRLACRAIRPAVRWTAVEGSSVDSWLTRHVDDCIRCQAEGARARRSVRRLATVFETVEVPPAALMGSVMAATLPAAADDHRIRAVSAAALAVTAGAVFLIRRHQLSSR
jgi:hypothetical protein